MTINTFRLIESLPITSEAYFPTFWCWESRIQSIVVACVRDLRLSRISYTRQMFTFKDGGEVGLDWAHPRSKVSFHPILGSIMSSRSHNLCLRPKILRFSYFSEYFQIFQDEDKETPILLILPGITGSSQSDYNKALVRVVKAEVGARVCVFNFRGRGGVKVKNPRTYCAANSEDLSEILDFINKTYPKAPVIALGISLGGILLGNYLAEKGESARGKLLAAILISVCFDTFEGTKSLETPGLNR